MEFFVQLLSYIATPAMVIAGVWFLLQYVFHLGEMNQRFENLVVDVEMLKKRMTKVESLIQLMQTNLAIIETHLSSATGLNIDLFRTRSPIRLTEKGEKLIEKAGFHTYVVKNEAKFLAQVKKAKIQSLFELDKWSQRFMESAFTKKELAQYEELAFTEGVAFDVLQRACALYLRDHLARELDIGKS